MQSSRQNNFQPSKQIDRSFLSLETNLSGLDHYLGRVWPHSGTSDVRMLLASGAEGVLPLPEAAGMARRHEHGLHVRCLLSHGRCCRIRHSTMCWLVPEGASRAPWVSSRGRGRPCRLPNAYGSLWSCSSCSGSPRAISMDQPGLQERKGNPSSRSAVTQEHANTLQEPSPMLVAQWHVPQANACACPGIICSALQRSEACQVSCARGRSAYCQCGSCNGIALSSGVCGCR